jgi:hypothetical protein
VSQLFLHILENNSQTYFLAHDAQSEDYRNALIAQLNIRKDRQTNDTLMAQQKEKREKRQP